MGEVLGVQGARHCGEPLFRDSCCVIGWDEVGGRGEARPGLEIRMESGRGLGESWLLIGSRPGAALLPYWPRCCQRRTLIGREKHAE